MRPKPILMALCSPNDADALRRYSAVKVLHEPAEIWHGVRVAEFFPKPLETAPQHSLIAVDHRLAERLLDRRHRLDLRRVGATEENRVGFRAIVVAGEIEPALRRHFLERGGAAAAERDVVHHREPGGGEIADDVSVGPVRAKHHELAD